MIKQAKTAAIAVLVFSIYGICNGQGNKTFDLDQIYYKREFKNISVDDGLSNNLVTSIVQDSFGYLWIGTADGMCRYGGNEFVVFRNNTSKKETISNNHIYDLFYDSLTSKIYIGTDAGLEIFDQVSETFTKVPSAKGKLLESSCNRIINDENGTLYALFSNNLIVGFNESDTTVVQLQKKDNAHYLDVILNENKVLVASSDGFVDKYDIHRNAIEARYQIGASRELNYFSHINEKIVLATAKGLFSFENEGFEKVDNSALNSEDIVRVFQDKRGFLWVGTRQEGLLISNKPVENLIDSNVSFEVLKPAYDGSSVFGKTIQVITEDSDQGIWLGSWSSGLNYTKPQPPNVHLIHHNPIQTTSISHNRVWGLAYGGNNKLWIGTDGGGVNRYNLLTGENKIYRKSSTANSISGDAVLCATYDHNGFLWFGTYKAGLNRFDPNTRQFTTYKFEEHNPYSIRQNDVRLLFEDSKNQLWVGTNNGGLQIWDPDIDGFLRVPYFENTDVRSIVEAPDGGFWVGVYWSWFGYYHPDENIFRRFDQTFIPELTNNRVSSLLLSDNYLWIGTRNAGLLKLNLKDSSYTHYDEQVGLINNSVRALSKDSAGDLWISTDRGISYLSPLNEQIINYDDAYGVQSGEFNVGSTLNLNGKLICFGGTKGLNILNTEELKRQENNSKIIVSQINVYDEPISSIDKKEMPLFTDFYELDHNQNTLRFEFEVLNLPKASDELFYYRLLGNEEQWNIARGSSAVTYANLKPDTYILEVSRNGQAGESRKVQELTLQINPPIWGTTTAFIIYFLISLLIIWIVMRYYTNQVKLTSSLDFEKKIREEEKKLNTERIRFFTNFSHELRTPLTLIIGPLKKSISEAKSMEVKKKLELIYRNALKLNNLINKMLDFRRVQSDQMKLKFKYIDFPYLLKNIIENYRDHTKIRGINLYMEPYDEELLAWVDIEKIEIIMNNLLSNALKYTQRKGWVRVKVGKNDEMIRVSVADNGSGIPEESLSSIFKWYYQAGESKNVSGTGIGLALTQKLVELHGGDITVSSKVGEGSEFVFTVENIEPGEDEKHYEEENLKIEIPMSSELPSTFPEATEMDNGDQAKARILVVDDNQDIVHYIKHVLSDKYLVFSALDGERGVSLAMEEVPDLIISDVMMPVKSGIDLCKTLKNDPRTSHIPIILLTAKHSVEDTILGYSEGADSYMTKPFDENVLLIRIENLLRGRIILREFFINNLNSSDPEKTKEDIKVSREVEFLSKVENTILDQIINHRQEVGVYGLAKELGFSRASLYRKLKTVSGYSINEFIRKVRLKKANELIIEGQMNVSEAAFYVGFNDIKYFRSIFKKEFGRLPSDVKSEAPDRLL